MRSSASPLRFKGQVPDLSLFLYVEPFVNTPYGRRTGLLVSLPPGGKVPPEGADEGAGSHNLSCRAAHRAARLPTGALCPNFQYMYPNVPQKDESLHI